MVYKPGVQADPSNEYRDLVKPSVINSIFHEYLPTYNENEKNIGEADMLKIYMKLARSDFQINQQQIY